MRRRRVTADPPGVRAARTTSPSGTALVVGEPAQPAHQVGVAQRPAPRQGAPAFGGEPHPGDAPVAVVLLARHEARPPRGPPRSWSCSAVGPAPMAASSPERGRAQALDRGQGGDLRRGHAAGDLLAQPARQAAGSASRSRAASSASEPSGAGHAGTAGSPRRRRARGGGEPVAEASDRPRAPGVWSAIVVIVHHSN